MHLDLIVDDELRREIVLKQLDLRQFNFNEDVKLSVAPSTIFKNRYEVFVNEVPLLLVANNLKSVDLYNELRRGSLFLMYKFLKVLDKKKLKSKPRHSEMDHPSLTLFDMLYNQQTIETFPKKFGEYKIKSAFIEELRGDKADFILEVVVEKSEFYSLADCFKEKVISQVEKKNYSVKPWIEFLNALNEVNSNDEYLKKTSFQVKSIIDLLLRNNIDKEKLYEPNELRGINRKVLTTDFEYSLFNDPLRIALQGIYSHSWKGPLWTGIKSKMYDGKDFDEFLEKLNAEQKRACQVYYHKYTQPHMWDVCYKNEFEIIKNNNQLEKLYLENLSSSLNFNIPLFLKFVDVSLK